MFVFCGSDIIKVLNPLKVEQGGDIIEGLGNLIPISKVNAIDRAAYIHSVQFSGNSRSFANNLLI